MPYISLDNLTQYNGRLRDYIDGSFDKLDGANWRKTSAGQSVSCWPIPESPLEPEVAFKFSEVPPESGTKGPDNPSTIVGVESVSCNVCESEEVYDTPYSIDLGGTYYGGTVNFATGVLEVTWKIEELDGTENWLLESTTPKSGDVYTFRCANVNRFARVNNAQINSNAACSHYATFVPSGTAYNGSFENVFVMWAGGGAVILSYPSDDVDDFKSWLASEKAAGHPVKVVFETPITTTVPLTPVLVRSLPALSHYTPRQNTIYTPHESVQVGYAKSASKTSQDLANAIVALGGNV